DRAAQPVAERRPDRPLCAETAREPRAALHAGLSRYRPGGPRHGPGAVIRTAFITGSSRGIGAATATARAAAGYRVIVQYRAPFLLLQALSPALAEGASVVMLSSLTARRATGAVAAYGSMKAAIESMVLRAAAEFGPRWIRVNAVAPATTATDFIKPWTQTE